MENMYLPVYTPGESYASGVTIRYGNDLYISNKDVLTAPQEFNEEDWVKVENR